MDDLDDIKASIEALTRSVDSLLRAVQGEIDAGNVGLVRRVAVLEARIDAEVEKANSTHKDMERANHKAHQQLFDQIQTLKLRMAGYGFAGSGAGGALLIAIFQLLE